MPDDLPTRPERHNRIADNGNMKIVGVLGVLTLPHIGVDVFAALGADPACCVVDRPHKPILRLTYDNARPAEL
jgi:hypothetical protein